MLNKVIRESLEKEYNSMKLKKNCKISENLRFHLEEKIPLSENIFRFYSESYFDLINEVRLLFKHNMIELNEEDEWFVNSDIGKKVILENGEIIYLDAPFEIQEQLNEAKHHGKNVKLNSPFRTPGGPKKFAVYVKTPRGTIKKVTFGDPNLKIKNANRARAKSFRARHKCDQKKDRTTAGYWSCNVSRYKKKLGLKSSRSW